MVMYYQTKFSCKIISSSEDIVETITAWFYELMIDLDDSKTIFSQGTLAHDDETPDHVWLQKVE